MHLLRLFVLGLIVATTGWSVPYKIDLSFDQLVLKNGRVFRKCTVRSYDHADGKVVVMADRQITSFQVELLPEDLVQKILGMIPDEAKDERRAQRAEQSQMRAESTRANTTRVSDQAETSRRRTEQAKALADEKAKTAETARHRAEATRLARTKADRYFRYEFKPGSGATVQIRHDIDLEEPRAVTGWPNRYRVEGQIGLEYYDSKGRSFNSTTQRFEVTVAPDDRGVMVIVDFSLK